ncbi:MAG: hybrid sensor histidine kinase/response regulator [Lentisphaerae bacterium]|jgi:two-component system, sensor histidine kinase and response regulator|nr:hybrid sensor histidine kinase/response regulator [Lentisphaerota bacterium]MBT4817118.1 hybrid sensor histidine kinase/response regulator [Lentisphaerota bacterium]MBT5612768.1 hybrid sensor histidine kinase/response regulator [Lentisphaerota bacterium]MBT7053984.1 hybrid sensor histidine kinase/response regulator [Lentisphaerota bacterium]MBT7846085.1 hybrid sensor histidine kinase/response regulator [Lentisphaerota bacterium]
MTDDRATILIVDDTPENVDVLVGILRDAYRLKVATDGQSALELAAAAPPDLILLDIMMPGLDGFEVCQRLKAHQDLRDVPVIFVSALDGTGDKVRAFREGGVDYVTKPFRPDEVEARVATHLRLRRQHRELEQSYGQLRELEQLRDSLIHMILHDMRTPLMAASAGLSLLVEGNSERSESERTFLPMVQSSICELTMMTEALLDISRMESGQMPVELADHDLRAIAEGAIESSNALAEFEETELTLAGESSHARFDQNLIHRVLLNLLGNAIKASGSGAAVEVRVSSDASTGRVEVSDTGHGVPAEYREKIFEKFGQAETRRDKEKHSTGLGLTFCKLAVAAHGGKIGVDSEVGKGSTFWFVLPRGSGRKEMDG